MTLTREAIAKGLDDKFPNLYMECDPEELMDYILALVAEAERKARRETAERILKLKNNMVTTQQFHANLEDLICEIISENQPSEVKE